MAAKCQAGQLNDGEWPQHFVYQMSQGTECLYSVWSQCGGICELPVLGLGGVPGRSYECVVLLEGHRVHTVDKQWL